MSLAPIFEFIIGLLFIWYLLSGVTMQVQEWLASALRWRAGDLYLAIQRMFGDKTLVDMFYFHPVIKGLSGKNQPVEQKPSYIPANQFSSVVENMLVSAGHELFLLRYSILGLQGSLKKIKGRDRMLVAARDYQRLMDMCFLTETSTQPENEGFNNLVTATIEKELANFAIRNPEIKADIESVQDNFTLIRNKVEAQFESLRMNSIIDQQTPPILAGMIVLGTISSSLGVLLNSMLAGVGREPREGGALVDIIGFKDNVEQWFNDSMDRLSGWYKRKAQLSAFIIGLVISLVFNIDSLELSERLWIEPVFRQSLQNSLGVEQGSFDEMDGAPSDMIMRIIQNEYYSIPVGWNFIESSAFPDGECAWAAHAPETFGFRIGSTCYKPVFGSGRTNGWLWILKKILGLLISAGVCTQGSSFWFDILKKFINVRLTGIKPGMNGMGAG